MYLLPRHQATKILCVIEQFSALLAKRLTFLVVETQISLGRSQ